MFSVGPILGFQPDFGLSEIYGFWVHFGGVGWAGMGWVGLDLARFRVSGGCFRLKTGFSSFVGHGGYVFMRPKAFPSAGLFRVYGFMA